MIQNVKKRLISMFIMTSILLLTLVTSYFIMIFMGEMSANVIVFSEKKVMEADAAMELPGSVDQSEPIEEISQASPGDNETSVDPNAGSPINNHLPEQSEDGLVEFEEISEEREETSDKQDEGRDNIVNMVFLGDTMMTGNVAKVMDQQGMDYPLQEFKHILEEADLIVINLETAVGTSGMLEEKAFAFQTDPVYLTLFKPYRNKVVFTLANNHGMDAPLDETMEALDDWGFSYVGIGKNQDKAFQPYVDEINGISFAIFGASQVIPRVDWRSTQNRPGMATAYHPEPLISYLTPWLSQVDYVITCLHWGEELADLPTKNQIMLEEALREAGVHLIIGSHPHVLQQIEWTGNKQLTAHSLGNFVFTTSHSPLANDTAALEVSLTREKIQRVRLHPAEIQWGLVRYLTEPDDQDRIFQRIRSLSHSVEIDEEGFLIRK